MTSPSARLQAARKRYRRGPLARPAAEQGVARPTPTATNSNDNLRTAAGGERRGRGPACAACSARYAAGDRARVTAYFADELSLPRRSRHGTLRADDEACSPRPRQAVAERRAGRCTYRSRRAAMRGRAGSSATTSVTHVPSERRRRVSDVLEARRRPGDEDAIAQSHVAGPCARLCLTPVVGAAARVVAAMLGAAGRASG